MKKIRVLLLVFILVTFGVNSIYAETELLADGYYAEVTATAPSGKKIATVTLKSNAEYMYVLLDTNQGSFGSRQRYQREYVWPLGDCNTTNYTRVTIRNLASGSPKTWITKVKYCDGTEDLYYDPYPPPEPEPPVDEGGTLPPSVDWGAVDSSKPANSCGQPRWTSPIRNWVDDIFCPVITFLDLAKAKLAGVSLVMGQGLNIGQYLRVFGDLPTSWQLVVSSLLLMVATLGALLIFRSAMRIYYSIKEGVKWW